jgi:hypothetical protein
MFVVGGGGLVLIEYDLGGKPTPPAPSLASLLA